LDQSKVVLHQSNIIIFQIGCVIEIVFKLTIAIIGLEEGREVLCRAGCKKYKEGHQVGSFHCYCKSF